MPLITPESVEAVRQAADLSELVRGRTELVRRGGRWWGRCPFHEEHTPSFSLIPPENRAYICFSCGAKGDAITWMMEKEGAGSFAEAVEALAERFGVQIRYERASPQEEAELAAAARRRELLDRAADFYAEYLWRADEAAAARAYLAERGFDEPLLRRFTVGYAPGGGQVLSRRAMRQGFTRDELDGAGLARVRGAAPHDFFTGRITFPIADARGRVQGFGARTLDPTQRAKYVNSPETPAFQKRRLLFGLAQARADAARRGWIVVAEGYTDVLALAAAGVDAAVACMGTSLTTDQLRILARVAREVRLCFDGDRAGQEAAWRTVEAARDVPVRLTAIALPPGLDPGDMAASPEGLAELARLADTPEPLVLCLVRARLERTDRASVAERERAFTDVVDLLRRLPDSLEKDEAVRVASGLLGLSPAMAERLAADARARRTGGAPSQPPRPPAQPLSADAERERRLLGLAVALPGVAPRYLAELPAEALGSPEHRRVRDLLVQGTPPHAWPEDLVPLGIELQARAAEAPATEAELREAVLRVEAPMLERRAAELRAAGDEAELIRVLGLLNRLRAATRAG
ncbi:MAG: DNA primase [Actinomycetota bacterium]